MSDFDLVIDHANSTSRLSILSADAVGDANAPSVTALSYQRRVQREPDQADSAQATVYRDAWADVEPDIDRTNDTVTIENSNGTAVFGGRFRDWQFEGALVTVLLDGPKVDAIDAEPSGGNDLYDPQNDDSILTNEILPRVDTISAGTVNTVDASIPFSESQASPGKSITKLAQAAGAETRYNPDFSLDYVSRLGADQTQTLSPSNGTIEGSVRIREKIREDVTHVRVLGAQTGTAQVVAEAVASSYSSSDREVWRQHTDKDIQQQARADALTSELVAEYDGDPEWLELEFEIPTSVAPTIGDAHPVDLPDYGIDQTLRIMELERIIDEAGDRFRAIVSNRKTTRETRGDQQARSLDEFREGNAGQIVRDSDSQGFDKIDSGEPSEWRFDYPTNVIDEYEAKLRVESRPFRRPADPVGHSHAFSVNDHTHDVVISDTTTSDANSVPSQFETVSNALGQFTLGAGDVIDIFADERNTSVSTGTHTDLYAKLYLTIEDTGTYPDDGRFTVQLVNQTTGDLYPDSSFSLRPPGQVNDMQTYSNGETFTFPWVSSDFNDNDDIDFRVSASYNADDVVFEYFVLIYTFGEHTHDVSISDTATSTADGAESDTTDSESSVEPGIFTETGKTVSNVSVEIDGTTVVSGLGPPIDRTEDIKGILTAGANQVTVSSDTLGEIRTSITFEALKNADS